MIRPKKLMTQPDKRRMQNTRDRREMVGGVHKYYVAKLTAGSVGVELHAGRVSVKPIVQHERTIGAAGLTTVTRRRYFLRLVGKHTPRDARFSLN